jgi:hypothetical protein
VYFTKESTEDSKKRRFVMYFTFAYGSAVCCEFSKIHEFFLFCVVAKATNNV